MFPRVAGLHCSTEFARLGLFQSDSKSSTLNRKELTMSDFFNIINTIFDGIVGVFDAGVVGVENLINSFSNLSS